MAHGNDETDEGQYTSAGSTPAAAERGHVRWPSEAIRMGLYVVRWPRRIIKTDFCMVANLIIETNLRFESQHVRWPIGTIRMDF